MRKRGREIEADYAARLAEERQQQTLTIRCAHCQFQVTGTLAEIGQAHLEHRHKDHPDIQPGKHRRRTRIGPQLTETTLHENIAKVRAQGGATWDGAAA